jgi:hypothetical protein
MQDSKSTSSAGAFSLEPQALRPSPCSRCIPPHRASSTPDPFRAHDTYRKESLLANTIGLFAGQVFTGECASAWRENNHATFAADHDILSVFRAPANMLSLVAAGVAPNMLCTLYPRSRVLGRFLPRNDRRDAEEAPSPATSASCAITVTMSSTLCEDLATTSRPERRLKDPCRRLPPDLSRQLTRICLGEHSLRRLSVTIRVGPASSQSN